MNFYNFIKKKKRKKTQLFFSYGSEFEFMCHFTSIKNVDKYGLMCKNMEVIFIHGSMDYSI